MSYYPAISLPTTTGGGKTIIERSRGVSVGLLKIVGGYEGWSNQYYRERRVIKANTDIILLVNKIETADYGFFGIYDNTDDKLPSAYEYVFTSGFDTTKIKDYKDDTYSTPPSLTLNPGQCVDHVEWDFPDTYPRFIIYKLESTDPSVSAQISYFDGRAWSSLDSVSNGVIFKVFLGYVNRVLISTCNFGSSAIDISDKSRFYTIEVYNAGYTSGLSKTTKSYASDVLRTLSAIYYNTYYQLLEAISP